MALDLYRLRESLRDLRWARDLPPRKLALAGLSAVLLAVAAYLILFRGTSPPPLTPAEQKAVQAVDAVMPDESKSYTIPVREPGSGRVPVQAPPR
ncbi:MAG: hypothetical protein FJ255_04925 [Phycisphaerae bacterium]|nr:hypothetical protein [Phycisphaerae bacterium]